MRKLIALGKEEKVDFMKAPMITGLYGIARKDIR
jgi:hypothetical protein